MKPAIQPQLRYGDPTDDWWGYRMETNHSETEWLCIPLTPESRRAMVGVMCRAIAEDRTDTNALEIALDALIKLANQEQP